jgi:putative zinc finger/helix-turn-helix YgiT family protein
VSLTRTEEFDFALGDETLKVRAENVPVRQCDNCGEVMSGPEAANVRHEAICGAAGLLPPAAIKALRERFDWSQEHLADLTGFGVATISRWERGRLLQNRSNNKVLLALGDCTPFREYLEGLVASKRPKQEPGPTSIGRVRNIVRSKVTKDTCAPNLADSNPAGAINRIREQFPHVADAEKASIRARAFQVAPGVN